MEDFIASNQLHIVNEESPRKTFQSSRGESNIDLTIVSNQMLVDITGWDIAEEESASDHNIITFGLKIEGDKNNERNSPETKYTLKEGQHKEFYKNFFHNISKNFQIEYTRRNTEDIDERLYTILKEQHKTFYCKDGRYNTGNMQDNMQTPKQLNHKSKRQDSAVVDGHTTIMRKRTNSIRRLYQRTKNNNNLRETRRKQYAKAKTEYQSAIKKEKTISWKKHCTATSPTNPWTEIYKIAAGKTKQKITMTTLQKPDGTTTADMMETLTLMMEYIIPDDNTQEDTEYHKTVRSIVEQPIDTPDDTDFTQDEVRQVTEGFKPSKAPCPDGITSGIHQLVYNGIPKTMNAIYNERLKTGYFPTNWKTARILPLTKLGRENSTDPSKYRPISLINTGGKILEKLLINRIMHHVYKTESLNENQYGFTPQKNTTDVTIEAKKFIEPQLEKGGIVIMASLDVRSAFDTAWYSAILKGLRDTKCPQNLYYLTQNYLKERKAVINISNHTIEKTVTRGCPQGSCCGPGLWNIQYDPILKLNYTKHKSYCLCG